MKNNNQTEKPNISIDTDNLVKGWYQLPHHITKQLIPSIEKRPYAKLAIIFILLKTDAYRKTEAKITFREISAFTGASRSTLTRELAFLESELKLISRIQKIEGKDYTYTLNKYWNDEDLVNEDKSKEKKKDDLEKTSEDIKRTPPALSLTPAVSKKEQGVPKIKIHLKETIKKNNLKKINNKKYKTLVDDFDYSEFSFGLDIRTVKTLLKNTELTKLEIIDSARNFESLIESDVDRFSKIINKLGYFIATMKNNGKFEKASISEAAGSLQKSLIKNIISNIIPGQRSSQEVRSMMDKLNEKSETWVELQGGFHHLAKQYNFEFLINKAS